MTASEYWLGVWEKDAEPAECEACGAEAVRDGDALDAEVSDVSYGYNMAEATITWRCAECATQMSETVMVERRESP